MKIVDGLARAKASGAVDADFAAGIRGGGFCGWLFAWFVSDDAAYIRRWCCSHYVDHCAQLAFLQSPPPQVVGFQWSGSSSQAPASEIEEEAYKAEVGQVIDLGIWSRVSNGFGCLMDFKCTLWISDPLDHTGKKISII